MEQSIQELYQQVLDRKENPVAGSYTDYLYQQGLDKILKKVGEESTEVVLGAKNSPAELTYETADLFFHLMVLLVNQGVTLKDIEVELGSRLGKQSKLHERADWRSSK